MTCITQGQRPQNSNPTMSEAKQYTQELRGNEKTESTPKDFMNYREIRCENDCAKKDVSKQTFL